MADIDLRSGTVAPGTVVAERVAPPITRALLSHFGGASYDTNPIHVDIDFARAAGQPDVFAHGMLIMARLVAVASELADVKRLRSSSGRFVAMTKVGDEIRSTARLVEYRDGPGGREAVLELVAADQAGEIKIKGEAVIALA